MGAGPKGSAANDWPEVWKHSPESNAVQEELGRLVQQRDGATAESAQVASQTEFAIPFSSQLYLVTHRVFQQYWRTPSYVWSKLTLGTMAGLFIGFSFFDADNTVAGTEGVIFGVYTVTALIPVLAQQVRKGMSAQGGPLLTKRLRCSQSSSPSGRCTRCESAQPGRTRGRCS